MERFLKAQEYSYLLAKKELENGRKESHWMWYIFPQIKGLGRSSMANYYAIKDIQEAKAYLNHEVLKARLNELCHILLKLEEQDPVNIFGYIDAMKLQSCMTLFMQVDESGLYQKVLDKFYNGRVDEKTLELIKK